MDKLQSFLGTESELNGEIASKGILRIDGTVNGKVRADQVLITEKSLIKGEINARIITVNGKAEGILRADELVEIKPKGKVDGDIYTRKLLITAGGKFNGKIDMNSGTA